MSSTALPRDSGWTTNGIIGGHFVPAAHDHGMRATTAAGLFAVVGLFDIAGTIGSGWLTDRIDPRKLLAVYDGLRGLAPLAVPAVLGTTVEPPLLVIVALFGLDWVATVAPTVVLCRTAFGLERAGIIFGWVFAAHMVGAGVAAAASGTLRATSGDRTSAWLLAGVLAVGQPAPACSCRAPSGPAPRRHDPRARVRCGRPASGAGRRRLLGRCRRRRRDGRGTVRQGAAPSGRRRSRAARRSRRRRRLRRCPR